MVAKIKNISVANTPEKINLDWSAVISRKAKLLTSSDWTQLSDVYLAPDVKASWKEWRAKLRRVKRTNNYSSEQANAVLDILETSAPKDDIVHEEYEIKELVKTIEEKVTMVEPVEAFALPMQHTPIEKIIEKTEKIFVEKHPILIREEISLETLREKFFEIFSQDNIQLHSFFLDLLNKIPVANVYDSDTLEQAKAKVKEYLFFQQKYIFNKKKLAYDFSETITEKYEQALEFLTHDALVEDYPLIELHVQLRNSTASEVAYSFLEDKKKLNQIIVEAEKFLMYNRIRIDSCTDIESLRELVIEIKNGY